MGSAHIITRVRVDGRWVQHRKGLEGERRYIVRFRLAGRESKLRHGGSFGTEREAKARRRYLLDEMAAGRVPDLNPERRQATSPRVAVLVEGYIDSRRDVGAKTRENYGYAHRRIPPWMLAIPAEALTVDDVQGWVNGMDDDPATGVPAARQSLSLLRRALEHGGVEPNPAAKVTAPTYRSPEINPPSAADLLAVCALLAPHWARLLCVIEGTGMRVGEATSLLGRDVDRGGGRIRVSRERTKGRTQGRRWIPVGAAVLAMLPDADPDRRALPFRAKSFSAALDRAHAAGAVHVTPHSLRHRHASRLVAQGLPITVVRERLGHAQPSMTLDVYSHVLLHDGIDPAVDLAALWWRPTT